MNPNSIFAKRAFLGELLYNPLLSHRVYLFIGIWLSINPNKKKSSWPVRRTFFFKWKNRKMELKLKKGEINCFNKMARQWKRYNKKGTFDGSYLISIYLSCHHQGRAQGGGANAHLHPPTFFSHRIFSILSEKTGLKINV